MDHSKESEMDKNSNYIQSSEQQNNALNLNQTLTEDLDEKRSTDDEFEEEDDDAALEIISDKVVLLMMNTEGVADKYTPAVRNMQEAINRHWKEFAEFRRRKEVEYIENTKNIDELVTKTLEKLDMMEKDENTLKEQEMQGVRISYKIGQELTPISWQRFEETKFFVALILDNMTEASECQSAWTKKSREKAVRVEKEIVMLRQLLDEGLPKEAVSYLTLVSDCLREIEKVIRKLQKEEEKWTKAESRLIEDISIQKEKMYKIPKGEKNFTPLIFDPLREVLIRLQHLIE